jgi:nucleoid-associated protein YgaU
VQVSWGEGLFMQAVVESVQQEFSLFNAQGVPVRATLTLSLREYLSLEEQISGVKKESSTYTKRRPVLITDTLSLIAYEEYNDAAQWKLIAEFNNLEIPPLDAGRRT